MKMKKKNMTTLDYNIRFFAVVASLVFVLSLAFIAPTCKNIKTTLDKASNDIRIQMLEKNLTEFNSNND